jgi:hypothetical protein
MGRSRWLVSAALAFLLLSCGSHDGGSGASGGASGDPADFVFPPHSCAYQCPGAATTCEEATRQYQCPGLAKWNTLPHVQACGSWDGKYPHPTQGKCTASAPSGEALKYTGADPDVPGGRVLPDGRLMHPMGKLSIFQEADLDAGLTTGLIDVPGSPYVLTVDSGNGPHAVRVVDTTLIGQKSPVKSYVRIDRPELLNSSLAFVPPDLVLVSTANGKVQGMKLDTTTGQLTLDDSRSITLPDATNGDPYFVAGLGVSPDGSRLVVSAVNDGRAVAVDLTPASYGSVLGEVGIGGADTFGVYFDPNDPSGRYAYVSLWADSKVAEIDLGAQSGPALSRTFDTEKDPEQIAFLDARWMVVANDLGETLSLVDRVSGQVTPVPVDFAAGLHGLDVSGATYDAASQRLYVTLSGINMVGAYQVDTSTSTPSFKPLGRLPTGWWPSGLVVHPDGSLTVTTMRGYGAGPVPTPTPIADNPQQAGQRGGVQQILAPSAQDLVSGEQQALHAVEVAKLPGYPQVKCPAGVKDFPVPATNTEGPSKQIKHIFYVVRENKTFDALLGDLPGVNGEPKGTMKKDPADMEKIWGNLRELARTFAQSDNSYTEADASIEGHAWTTYSRVTDYCERNWSTHARDIPGCGISKPSTPTEGSLFVWLGENNVRYDLLGELVGVPDQKPAGYDPVDHQYPGGAFQAIGYPDNEKACYVAARARVLCNLGSFIYMTLPNDHTDGVGPSLPTPEVMVAVNDEATGMLVDAVSHSPLWESSLIVITEDDPQQGADHVDYHRVPLVVVSPWVKRGYVSKTHLSVSGVHKIFAHILGLPYPNLQVQNAALPFDLFTSTPDYTPYTYKPRGWPLECGGKATRAERQLTSSWTYDRVDNQPGLDAQVMRWMRDKQLTRLSPEQKLDIELRRARNRRRQKLGLSGAPDDD